MIVRELLTVLGFQTDDKSVKSYEQSIKSLTGSLAAVTAAAGAVGAGLFGLMKMEANAADASAKLGRQLGLTATQAEALKFAEGQTGATGFTNSLARLSNRLSKAGRDSGAAKAALEQYGIAATNADGSVKNLNEILPELADRFKDLGDAQRADLARDLGFSLESVLLLGEGSEGIKKLTDQFVELGGGINQADAEGMEKFNDTIAEGMVVIASIHRAVAVNFLPVMQELVETFRDWFTANRKVIQQRLQKAIEVISGALRVFWTALTRTIGFIDDLVQRFGGWEQIAKIVGMTIVAMLGIKAVKAIYGMVAAVRALSLAMWANPIGLIIAAVVALSVVIGLIIEDIYQWAKGNDSLFGSMFGNFDALAAKAKEIWARVKADFIDPFIMYFKGLKDVLVGVFTLDWDLIKSGFASMTKGMTDWARNIATVIKDLILSILPDWMIGALEMAGGAINKVGDVLGTAGSFIGDTASDIGGFFSGLNPFSSSPASDLAANQSNNSTVNMSAKVDINVPAGTTTEQAKVIDTQVREAMRRELQLSQQNIVVSQ